MHPNGRLIPPHINTTQLRALPPNNLLLTLNHRAARAAEGRQTVFHAVAVGDGELGADLGALHHGEDPAEAAAGLDAAPYHALEGEGLAWWWRGGGRG